MATNHREGATAALLTIICLIAACGQALPASSPSPAGSASATIPKVGKAVARRLSVGDATTTVFDGHRKPIQVARFSADGKLFATASNDGGVRLWSSSHLLTLRAFQGPEVPLWLRFSPNGERLVAASGGLVPGRAVVWDVRTGTVLAERPLPPRVDVAAVSDLGELTLTPEKEQQFPVAGGGSIRLVKNQLILTPTDGGPEQTLAHLTGGYLLTPSPDNTVFGLIDQVKARRFELVLVNIKAPSPVRRVPLDHFVAPVELAISNSQERASYRDINGAVVDVHFDNHNAGALEFPVSTAVAAHPSGAFGVTATPNGLCLFVPGDFPGWKRRCRENRPEPSGLASTPSGQLIAAFEKTILPIDVSKLTEPVSYQSYSAKLADNGNFAIFSDGNSVVGLRLSTQHPVDLLSGSGRQDPARAATAVSGDGHRVAAVNSDGLLEMEDLRTGERVKSPARVDPEVHPPFAVGDGFTVWQYGGGKSDRIELLDARTGTVLRQHETNGIATHFARRGPVIGWVTRRAPTTVQLSSAVNNAVELPLESPVTALSLSPTGGQLAVGTSDQRVRVFDVATRRLQSELVGGSGKAMTFLPQNRLASADSDGEIRLWDLTAPAYLGSYLRLDHDLWTFVAADGTFEAPILDTPLVYGVRGNDVVDSKEWSRRYRRVGLEREHVKQSPETLPVLVYQTAHRSPVVQVGFTADTNYLVSRSEDHEVRIWDVRGGVQLAAAGHANRFALDPRSNQLLLDRGRGELELWDVATARPVRRVRAEIGGLLGWDESGHVSFDRRTTVDYLHLDTGRAGVRGLKRFDQRGMAISASGRLIGFGLPLAPVSLLTVGKSPVSLPYYATVAAIAFRPDDGQAATAEVHGWVRLWDPSNGRALKLVRLDPFDNTSIEALTYSPDGKQLYAGTRLGLRIIDPGTGTVRAPAGQPLLETRSLAVSRDGKRLAAGMKDGTVRTWDATSELPLASYGADSLRIEALAVNPVFPELAYTTGSTLRFWDGVRAGERLAFEQPFPEKERAFDSIAFSPDGTRLAVAAGEGLRVIDRAGNTLWSTAEPRRRDQRHRAVRWQGSTVVTREKIDGRLMPVSGLTDKWLTSRDAATGEVLSRVLVNDGDADYALSPDGLLLVVPRRHQFEVIRLKTGVVEHAISTDTQGSYLGAGEWQKTPCFADAQTVVYPLENGELRSLDLRSGRVQVLSRGVAGYALQCMKDGTVLGATGGGQVFRLELRTGRELPGSSGWGTLQSLSLSHDRRWAVGLTQDGLIRFIDPRGGRTGATLVAAPDGSTLLGMEDGTYAAAPGARHAIAFRVGTRAYPFEQFDALSNQPDSVLTRLGWSPPEVVAEFRQARERRLKALGLLQPRFGDGSVPTVAFVGQAPATTSNTRELELQVRATGSHALARINIDVNDVPWFGAAGLDVRGKNSTDVQQSIKLLLSQGRNRIQVSAVDVRGVQSLRETLELTYTGPRRTPNLYLVALGVSRYANRRYDLVYPSKDAADIMSGFSATGLTFANTIVHRLVDQEVTRERILALRAELMKSEVDDTVVFFIAGHGLVDGRGRYYFGTHDVDAQHPERRGLAYAELEGLLDGLAARQRLLLIDTCFAGERESDNAPVGSSPFVKSRALKFSAPTQGAAPPKAQSLGAGQGQRFFADLRRGTGTQVIAAAAGSEFSFEDSKWQNGVFTYSVLQGLVAGAADGSHDGSTRVSELRDFVALQVRQLTQGRQTPNSRAENLENDFEVGKGSPAAPRGTDGCDGGESRDSWFASCGAMHLGARTGGGALGAKLQDDITARNPTARFSRRTVVLDGGKVSAEELTVLVNGELRYQYLLRRLPAVPTGPAEAYCGATYGLPLATERCRRVLPKLGLKYPRPIPE